MKNKDIIKLLDYIIDNTNKTATTILDYCLQEKLHNKIIKDDHDVINNLYATIGANIYDKLFGNSYRPKEIFDTIQNISRTLNLLLYSDNENKLCVNKKDLNKLKLTKKLLNEK